jgi:hypothetical protein
MEENFASLILCIGIDIDIGIGIDIDNIIYRYRLTVNNHLLFQKLASLPTQKQEKFVRNKPRHGCCLRVPLRFKANDTKQRIEVFAGIQSIQPRFPSLCSMHVCLRWGFLLHNISFIINKSKSPPRLVLEILGPKEYEYTGAKSLNTLCFTIYNFRPKEICSTKSCVSH